MTQFANRKVKNQIDNEATVGTAHPDPWKQRSLKMSCRTCMWYVAKVGTPGMDATEVGRCRRHAPSMHGYPVVFEADWCGDHKLDENKVGF